MFNKAWAGAVICGVLGAGFDSSIGIAGLGGGMVGMLPLALIGSCLGYRAAPYISQRLVRPRAGYDHASDLTNAPSEPPASFCMKVHCPEPQSVRSREKQFTNGSGKTRPAKILAEPAALNINYVHIQA